MTAGAGDFDAAVIGAGVAGLAAATALSEAGRRVLVLEARGVLGGRATAFRDRETGELVDNGQHVLFGCYHETFRLLERIGAGANVRTQPTLEVPYISPDGNRSVLRCPPWPSPLHLLGGILGWDALTWTDRLGALRIAPALLAARRDATSSQDPDATSPAAPRGDGETVSQWLTRHGQRGRLREWLWEPLAVAALNQAPEEAAAEPFLRVLAGMFGSRRQDASMVLPQKPLDETYAVPAKAFVEARGGDVRTHALARIRLEGGRLAGLDVRGEVLAPPPIVIAAVPWFALSTLFIGDVTPLQSLLRAAAAMQSKPIVTVNLWYDRPVMDETFVGLPGRSMQWVFDKRRAFGEEASHLSLVSSGADALVALDRDALIALAGREIAEAIPAARGAVLRRGTVVREKRATFSLAPGEPARPGVVTGIPGLFLAGDWIATGLPGTIESAAIAGHRAAAAALA